MSRRNNISINHHSSFREFFGTRTLPCHRHIPDRQFQLQGCNRSVTDRAYPGWSSRAAYPVWRLTVDGNYSSPHNCVVKSFVGVGSALRETSRPRSRSILLQLKIILI